MLINTKNVRAPVSYDLNTIKVRERIRSISVDRVTAAAWYEVWSIGHTLWAEVRDTVETTRVSSIYYRGQMYLY